MASALASKPATYDRMKELIEFDETKAGVKGLADSGMKHIPKIFIHSPEHRHKPTDGLNEEGLQVPVIDLQGVIQNDPNSRHKIVEGVRAAAKEWGFFHLVNHGVEQSELDGMMGGIRRFHEQETDVKANMYLRDARKKVKWYCNFDLFKSPAANWRDSLACTFDGTLDPQDLPAVCREVLLEFRQKLWGVADTVCEILSEALGLEPNYLKKINCTSKQQLYAHYYPSCPEPELTMGTSKHGDPSFLTLLLQDDLGGLQVLHQNKWVDVSPIHGALVVNIGDVLQLMSNDKFTSVEHRVLASSDGPRLSVAIFYSPTINDERPYGPIKEVLSEENRPIYKEILMMDYMKHYTAKGLDGISALAPFKL